MNKSLQRLYAHILRDSQSVKVCEVREDGIYVLEVTCTSPYDTAVYKTHLCYKFYLNPYPDQPEQIDLDKINLITYYKPMSPINYISGVFTVKDS